MSSAIVGSWIAIGGIVVAVFSALLTYWASSNDAFVQHQWQLGEVQRLAQSHSARFREAAQAKASHLEGVLRYCTEVILRSL